MFYIDAEKLLNITVDLAARLVVEQFPEYADMAIKEVALQGHDNRSFRLGDKMLIRMPRAKSYAQKVAKEQEFLPQLARYINLPIPAPLYMGKPNSEYPFCWSIYSWIEGVSANLVQVDERQMINIAEDLGGFLHNLHAVELPGPEPSGGFRGGHIRHYDADVQTYLQRLEGEIDVGEVRELWNAAMATSWQQKPVWVHGDLASGNFLLREGRVCAVIDWAGFAVGDPACDLVITWTYLQNKSRNRFIDIMNIDRDTWLRVQAWCIWKAMFELCQLGDAPQPDQSAQHKGIIQHALEFRAR